MKADAVSMPSTAIETSGNRCFGSDAMPGDFLMALMGVLLQQGGSENSSAEPPGGLLFQQGEVVLNGLPAVSVAGMVKLYPQGQVPKITLPESPPGTESNLAGGKSMPNLLMPWVEPLANSTGTVAPNSISQPGPSALGVAFLGTPVFGQEANGAAQVLADGEMGASVQVLKGGETGVNIQVQVDSGNSGGARVPQALSTLQNSTVPAGAAGLITTVNNAEVLPDAAVPKGEAADYLPVKNSIPAGPVKVPGSAGGSGKNEYQTLSVMEEQTEHALPEMPERKEKASSISPAGRLAQNADSVAQVAQNGRPEAVQGNRDALAMAGQVEDSSVEAVCITDSDGAEGKGSDARPGGFELHGEMQISTTTQLSNITGKKLAAEIIPYVMNALKNSGGEKSRVTVLRMKLEPENLGEIKIRLSFAKGELTAHFYTASGLVKDAVEGSLPQLRETLSQYNINLGEANAFVGQEQQNNNSARFGGYHQGGSKGQAGINYPVSPAGDAARSEPGYGSSALDLLI
ncbi:MAG: flagellar hook-length control protein FliK [Actinobacteria bacterium]|nr:flagellar hook-length control protein FliK [Actinomycetota bacterium]